MAALAACMKGNSNHLHWMTHSLSPLLALRMAHLCLLCSLRQQGAPWKADTISSPHTACLFLMQETAMLLDRLFPYKVSGYELFQIYNSLILLLNIINTVIKCQIALLQLGENSKCLSSDKHSCAVG